MASITLNLNDMQLEKLQELAQKLGITPEELLQISINDWLANSNDEFVQAANYVLQKNADLYKKLA